MASGSMLSAWAVTDWYMLKSNGKPIGKVRIQSYPAQGKPGGTVTEVSNTGHFTRQGSPFEMNAVSRFVENTTDGKPQSFSYEYALGNQRLMEAQGQLQGNQLDLRMIGEQSAVAGKASVQEDQFLFPGGKAIQSLYRQHYDDAPGSRFNFQTLSMGMQPEIVNTEVTRLGSEKLALTTGGKKQVSKFQVQNSAHPQSGVYEWRDEQGKLLKAKSIGADGMEMVYASRRDVRELDRDSLDLVTASAVLSNPIAQPRITTEALYRITPMNGQTIDWSGFPEGDSQAVVDGGISSLQSATMPNAITLRVWQHPPADSSVVFPVHAQAKYLESTPFVESTDLQIDRTALSIVGKEKRAYYAARLIQQWVYRNIEAKDLSLGFASAKETLLSRQGDCTEHAVLFAALARALGIPTRVAIGLVYIPDGDSKLGRFVYHMWDEIYLGDLDQGEWVPMDATNPELMPDATHIKIADSALSSTGDLMTLTQNVVSLMGKMKIDVLKAISSAQSTLAVGKQSGVLAVDIPKVDIEQVDIRNLSRKAIKHFRVQLPPASLSMDTADGLFTYGVEALSKGQYNAAKSAFEKSLTKLRRPIEAYRMGERLAAIEMYELAGEAFQAAREKDTALGPLVDSWMNAYLPSQNLPDTLNRQFMAAMYGQGNQQELLQGITEQAPQFAPAYRHLGELSSGASGIEALKKAVALAPQDFRNNESLGDTLMDQERYSAATQAYRAACVSLMQTRFVQSKTWLDDVHGKWELAYGAALLAKNKRDAGGWLTMAKGLLRQNRQEEAAQASRNALILRPGYPEAQLYGFDLALKRADWQQIFTAKDRIAAIAGHNAQVAALLGQYQMHTRQYASAVQSLQRAIAINPKAVDAYLTLSQTYLRLADQQDAKRAAKLGGLGDKLRNQALAVLRRGMANVSAMSDRHDISLQLATLLLSSGKGAEAQSLAEQVLAENPINGRAYLLKGKAQFYQGSYPAARDTLETALVLNPNDPNVLVLLGHVAQEEGRDALAMDAYQKAYKADPLNEEAAKSYGALLDKLQIAGQKPPNYWYLTDDEHDYLVQLLYQGKQIKANTRNYLARLAALPGHGGQVDFSVQGIAAIQSFPPFINQLFETELNGYHRLQAMNVPPRFTQMHYMLLATSLGHLKIFDNAVQHFPTMNKITPQTAMAFHALLGDINGVDQSLSRVLSLISARLPEPVYQGLLSEAQLNDLPVLDQEIARLTTDLATRKTSKSAKGPLAKQSGPEDKTDNGKPDSKDTATPDATPTSQLEKQVNQMTSGAQSKPVGKL